MKNSLISNGMNKVLILNPPFSIRFRSGFFLRILRTLIFCLTLSLLIACIFQLNAHTKEIYLIKNYEKKLNQLSQENKILEIKFSNVNSLNNIGNYIQNQVFEKVGRVEYIQLLEGTALAR